jgi:hypothetical protein
LKRSLLHFITCEPYYFCSHKIQQLRSMTPRTVFCVFILLFMDGINAQSQAVQESSVITHRAGISVLSSGKWYKIKILRDGIYKLTYEDLKSMGFADPSGVRVFGNGGTMLPMMNSERRYDDLVENSIYLYNGSDGVFGPGDHILFYGRGPAKWKFNTLSGMFEHSLNLYSDAAFYFITADAGEGKKVTTSEAIEGLPNATSTTFNDYDFHEKNRYNFLKSGRQWFGERIEYAAFDTTFKFANLVTASPVIMKANALSRSAFTKAFIFRNNDEIVGSIAIGAVILNNSTGIYANQKSGQFNFYVTDDKVNVNVTYNKVESSDEGFLDYLTVNVRRKLIMTGDAMFFRDKLVTGSGKLALFTIENCTDAIQVWDVTDFSKIRKMPTGIEGSVISFKDNADSLKEYVALNPAGDFPKPIITATTNDLGDVPNQNLHGIGPTQMIIVTHPLFREAADSLALFHQQRDNITVQVVTTNQVFNEFSSGANDVSAIRDFAKMVYDRSTNSQDRLKYLLLFGDGSYNNMSQAAGNSNFILTYQSENSLNTSASYVSDDFFGFMGDQEGGSETMEEFSLDLGVGRLPAKNLEEAMVLYRKISGYNTKANRLDWRNNILFVGDDEDGNIHMSQANGLADWVRKTYPQFVVKKVLLDAYKQESTSTGARYPEVNRIITNDIQKGILIYNYTGHGGERGMAAEQILMREDLVKLTNSGNLPLFVTATCEFSRFDDLTDDEGTLIESTSAGETSLLNENGGSIALLSTTRIVYSDRNHYLNTKFYHVAFERDENGNYYRLGDIIRMTKDSSGIQRNKLNFILLGDPALALAVPEYSVQTDSLNGFEVSAVMDTLKAFSHVRISGHLTDISNQPMNYFNGTIYPSVFDKNLQVTTLSNDRGDPFQFETQENLLFKGKASVKNGRFSFEFMVPKDITYSFGKGKIVYYSEDSTMDANGYFNKFIIGGTDTDAVLDVDGPDISLYLNDKYFKDKGITNPNPVIYATISDVSGINTVGNGIGHDITGVIDGKVSEPVVLNDYFESDLNDYSSGKLSYPMFNLSEGWHSLTVKVWDIFNNSSEETIDFQVIPGENPVLSNVYNYPNPASHVTWFKFDHNKAGEEITISITVYDMEGRHVTDIQETVFAGGFSSEPLEWDLKDANGNMLRQGIYPYRVRITDKNGRFAESIKKLVVVRQ